MESTIDLELRGYGRKYLLFSVMLYLGWFLRSMRVSSTTVKWRKIILTSNYYGSQRKFPTRQSFEANALLHGLVFKFENCLYVHTFFYFLYASITRVCCRSKITHYWWYCSLIIITSGKFSFREKKPYANFYVESTYQGQILTGNLWLQLRKLPSWFIISILLIISKIACLYMY